MIAHFITHDLFRRRVVIYKFLSFFKYFSNFNAVFSKYGSYNLQKSFILPNKFAPVDRPKNYLSDKRSLDVLKEQFNTHYSSNKQVLAELKNGSFEPVSNIDFIVTKSNFITSVPSNSFKPFKDIRSFELLQQQCHEHLDKHKFVLVQLKTGKEVDSFNYQDFNVVKTEVGECLSALDDKDKFIVDLVCHSKRASSFDLNSLGIDITDPMRDLVVLATEVNHKSSPYFWRSYPYGEYRLTEKNVLDNFIQLINFKRDKLVFNPNEFKQWSLKNYPYKKPTSVAFEDMDLSLIKLKYQEILDGAYSNTSTSQLLENFTATCSNSDLQVFCSLAETALSHEFILPLLLPYFILAITPPPYSDVYSTANVYTSYLSLCEFSSIKEAFSIFRR